MATFQGMQCGALAIYQEMTQYALDLLKLGPTGDLELDLKVLKSLCWIKKQTIIVGCKYLTYCQGRKMSRHEKRLDRRIHHMAVVLMRELKPLNEDAA